MRSLTIILLASLGFFASPAWAIVNCSGTATASSAAISMRGPAQAHFEVQNPATNTGNICVNPFGGTAACGAAGNWLVVPGGNVWRDFPDLPINPQIVSPSGAQPYTCDYQ